MQRLAVLLGIVVASSPADSALTYDACITRLESVDTVISGSVKYRLREFCQNVYSDAPKGISNANQLEDEVHMLSLITQSLENMSSAVKSTEVYSFLQKGVTARRGKAADWLNSWITTRKATDRPEFQVYSLINSKIQKIGDKLTWRELEDRVDQIARDNPHMATIDAVVHFEWLYSEEETSASSEDQTEAHITTIDAVEDNSKLNPEEATSASSKDQTEAHIKTIDAVEDNSNLNPEEVTSTREEKKDLRPSSSSQQTMSSNPPIDNDKMNSGLIVAFVIAGVLVIGGGIAFLYFNQRRLSRGAIPELVTTRNLST